MSIRLQTLMCNHGPNFVLRPPRSGRPNSSYRDFNWTSAPFQVYSGQQIFVPRQINSNEASHRNHMLQLFSNSSFASSVQEQLVNQTTAAECDAFILSNNSLYEVRQGQPGSVITYTADRRRPNPPLGQTLIGYIHTHPTTGAGMRAPTVRADWGPSGQRNLMQLMVEARNGRTWGMIQPNVAVVLGQLTSGSFNPLDSNDAVFCFEMH